MNIRTLLPTVALAFGLCGPVLAKDDVFVSGDLKVNAGIEAGVFFGVANNPNFGVGRVDHRTGENTGDTQFGETYLEPSISFTYGSGKDFGLFGEASSVLSGTLGEGDAGGFSNGTIGDVDPEKYSLGFRTSFNGPGGGAWTLDASGGRQDVQIGDGFLIWDGNFDAFENAAYWLGPRSAFRWAGTADLSNGSFGVKPFYIQGDGDQDHSELVGADMRFEGNWGKLGALYGQIIASDDVVFVRDGMQLTSLRANGINIPGVEGLSFSAEYTRQFGDKSGIDFDANAYYSQAD